MINQLPKIISDILSRNSSNKEVFKTSKGEYEEALNRPKCTFLILQVLSTFILPAIDKFRILHSITSFSVLKTRFIKFSWFSIFFHMSNRLPEF